MYKRDIFLHTETQTPNVFESFFIAMGKVIFSDLPEKVKAGNLLLVVKINKFSLRYIFLRFYSVSLNHISKHATNPIYCAV